MKRRASANRSIKAEFSHNNSYSAHSDKLSYKPIKKHFDKSTINKLANYQKKPVSNMGTKFHSNPTLVLNRPNRLNKTDNLRRTIDKIEGNTETTLNDSATLMKELHDLSAEIATLDFNPKSYELAENLQLRTSKIINEVLDTRLKVNYKSLIFEVEDEIKKNIVTASKTLETTKSELVEGENEKADLKVDEPDCAKKIADAACETSPVEDYTDFKNLTFCNKEKTSSVSSYTISTDDESKGQPINCKEETVKEESGLEKSKKTESEPISKIGEMKRNEKKSKSETNKTTAARKKSTSMIYPDLKSYNLEEEEKNVSLTPKKRSFGSKIRRFFYSTEDTPLHKSKHSVISKKSKSNKLKNLTDKLKNKFTSHPKQSVRSPETNLPVPPTKCVNDQVQELLQELKIQQALIQQAGKALVLCQNTKEFNASIEQIESEKSLLLGNVKTKATLDEINRLMLEEELEITRDNIKSDAKGAISINCLELLLKREAVDELARKNQIEHFVVVVICRRFVWASKVLCNPYDNLNIVVQDKIVLPDISHDFKIKVQVYGMKLENSAKLSHDVKYRIRQKCKNAKKNSSHGIFSKHFRSSKRDKSFVGPLDSQFELVGELKLGVEDLHLKSPWQLDKVPKTTTLSNLINLKLSCKVDLTAYNSGFVNHGYIPEGYASWNRRWCVLKDHILKFWNYPQQEDDEPTLAIDLMNCVTPEIKVADRVVCAKPRTLVIETNSKKNVSASLEKKCGVDKKHRKIEKHFISLDTNEELNQWMSSINHVLSSLHKWNKTLYEETSPDNSINSEIKEITL